MREAAAWSVLGLCLSMGSLLRLALQYFSVLLIVGLTDRQALLLLLLFSAVTEGLGLLTPPSACIGQARTLSLLLLPYFPHGRYSWTGHYHYKRQGRTATTSVLHLNAVVLSLTPPLLSSRPGLLLLVLVLLVPTVETFPHARSSTDHVRCIMA